MDAVPIKVRDAVFRSRDLYLCGDFAAASETLQSVSTNESSNRNVIIAELVRNALFQGNHKWISTIVWNGSAENDAMVDLLSLMIKMNQIWTDLDLVEPVRLANDMFNRYCNDLTETEIDEFKVGNHSRLIDT